MIKLYVTGIELLIKLVFIPICLAYFAKFITSLIKWYGHIDFSRSEIKFVELVVIFTVCSWLLQATVNTLEELLRRYGFNLNIPLEPAALALLYTIMDN